MPNINAPQGFLDFQGNIGGATPNYGQISRQILYSDAVKIFTGDPVKQLATGYIAQWTAGTAVSQLIGIFQGCQYLSASQARTVWSPYWPGADVVANSVVTAFLEPCNLAVPPVFKAQSALLPFTIADIGMNTDVVIGTGNTATGRSGAALDQTLLAVTATLPFRIIGLLSDYAPPGSNGTDNTANFNWAIVAANVAGAGSTGI